MPCAVTSGPKGSAPDLFFTAVRQWKSRPLVRVLQPAIPCPKVNKGIRWGRGMPRQGGFTLVELMVTVAVLAIMAGLAVPSFQATVNANRLTGSTNELVNALQTARME